MGRLRNRGGKVPTGDIAKLGPPPKTGSNDARQRDLDDPRHPADRRRGTPAVGQAGPRVTRKTAGYGWLPDLPDHRDLHLAPIGLVGPLPPAVDLGAHCPPVYDQGQMGSCTAVSYTHLRAHETRHDLVCRLLLEKKKK